MPKTIKLTFTDKDIERIENQRKAYNKGKKGTNDFMSFKDFVYSSIMCDIQTLEMSEEESR